MNIRFNTWLRPEELPDLHFHDKAGQERQISRTDVVKGPHREVQRVLALFQGKTDPLVSENSTEDTRQPISVTVTPEINQRLTRIEKYLQRCHKPPQSPSSTVLRVSRQKINQLKRAEVSFIARTRAHLNTCSTVSSCVVAVLKVIHTLFLITFLVAPTEVIRGFGVIFSHFCSLFMSKEAQDQVATAQIEQNEERELDGKLELADGVSLATATLLTIATITVKFLSAATLLSLSIVSSAFFSIAAIVEFVICARNLNHYLKFREKLESFFNNPNLTEKEKIQGALNYIADKMFLNSDKESKIVDTNTKIATQSAKIDRFIKRVGKKNALILLHNLAPILKQLQNPETEAMALKQAELMLEHVKIGSSKNIIGEYLKMASVEIFGGLAFSFILPMSIILPIVAVGAFVTAGISVPWFLSWYKERCKIRQLHEENIQLPINPGEAMIQSTEDLVGDGSEPFGDFEDGEELLPLAAQ